MKTSFSQSSLSNVIILRLLTSHNSKDKAVLLIAVLSSLCSNNCLQQLLIVTSLVEWVFIFYELLVPWSLSVRAYWEAGDFDEMELCEKNKGNLHLLLLCPRQRWPHINICNILTSPLFLIWCFGEMDIYDWDFLYYRVHTQEFVHSSMCLVTKITLINLGLKRLIL